jgi:flagellar biogenesis protein FliO
MVMSDIKLYVINTTALAFSFADYVVDILRIILLVVTIVYTIKKIQNTNGNKNK